MTESHARQPATSHQPPTAAPAFPPTLQQYLSPALWEQLQAEPTRRGLLLDALGALHSLIYLLATYLPRPLVESLKRDPALGNVTGEQLEGTLFFADVSGFTALTERLAALGRAGSAELTTHLNTYFDLMVQILARSDGTLLKFGGDALLAYFPAQDAGHHALWATRAAQRMMRAMKNFAGLETPAGPVTLRMKVGLSTGPFGTAAVGRPKRMEYFIFGETVTRTLRVESTLTAGQIGIDAATAAWLPPEQYQPHTADFFTLTASPETLDDFEIRPETYRRGRDSGLLMLARAELYEHIETALQQLAALSAFLPAPLVSEIITYAYQRYLPGENRPMAILFLHLTGPQSLWDPADSMTLPRVVQALDACFAAILDSVARHGGVISHIDPYDNGSKFLILFSALTEPNAAPLRAVQAALEARARLIALRAQWAQAGDPVPGLSVRGGLTYNSPFASPVGAAIRREYTVMGDEVNLAARLMAAAQPEQLLVAPSVISAIENAVALTPLAPMKLKGKRDPVPVAQVDGLRVAAAIGNSPKRR